MRGFRDAGVNRVSLGVQSLHDRRAGAARAAAQRGTRAADALAEVRDGGIGNISLDLMLWLPQQTLADWQGDGGRPDRARARTMRRSTCSSSIRTRHCGRKWRARTGRSRPTTTRQTCTCGRSIASSRRGTAQYEISNVARAGRQVAPQPEVLAGRRVARLRLRRALDARRPAVEERRADAGVRRQDDRWRGAGRLSRVSVRPTSGSVMRCSQDCG